MPKIRISSLTGTTGCSPSIFRLFNSAGITAAIGLAALPVFLTLSPMFGTSEANAEPSTIGAAATIVPNLSLSAENVSMVMTPIGSGTVFKTASVDATVSTNNETGYTLYFSDKDNNTSLSHSNLADTAIASVETAATGTSMLPNTWGYTLSTPAPEGENEFNNTTNLGLTYKSIPTDYTTIKTRDTQTTPNETSKLTFGVKIDNSIPSGTYSDEILISAVINYSNPSTDWLDSTGTRITTMQQMTSDICASVTTPPVDAVLNVPEITLRDTRNDQTYRVRKLADGNCWMTEDLRIEDVTLTPANSDVTTDITLPEAVDSVSTGISGSYTSPKIGKNAINGAYLYNWHAAIAATYGYDVRDITGGNAPQSICPKGWKLPKRDSNGSWNKLFNTYTVDIAPYSDLVDSNSNVFGLHLTGTTYGGKLSGTSMGVYWGRTAYSDTKAHGLQFSANSRFPWDSNTKDHGRAIRCVSEGTS